MHVPTKENLQLAFAAFGAASALSTMLSAAISHCGDLSRKRRISALLVSIDATLKRQATLKISEISELHLAMLTEYRQRLDEQLESLIAALRKLHRANVSGVRFKSADWLWLVTGCVGAIPLYSLILGAASALTCTFGLILYEEIGRAFIGAGYSIRKEVARRPMVFLLFTAALVIGSILMTAIQGFLLRPFGLGFLFQGVVNGIFAGALLSILGARLTKYYREHLLTVTIEPSSTGF